MAARHATRTVKALRIYVPIDSDTLRLLMAGGVSSIKGDSPLAAILAVIGRDNPLGDFGLYKSVVEFSLGWEMFTPAADAHPTVGRAGTATVSPTAILTVYVPKEAPGEDVSRALDAIVQAHPWETPVIEINETLLLTRA